VKPVSHCKVLAVKQVDICSKFFLVLDDFHHRMLAIRKSDCSTNPKPPKTAFLPPHAAKSSIWTSIFHPDIQNEGQG
jgi:hypothetical protein